MQVKSKREIKHYNRKKLVTKLKKICKKYLKKYEKIKVKSIIIIVGKKSEF